MKLFSEIDILLRQCKGKLIKKRYIFAFIEKIKNDISRTKETFAYLCSRLIYNYS